tara:strand:+ start:449 stop:2422 length:1974 start_codon:yes stop_codon:yes gene_type:complete
MTKIARTFYFHFFQCFKSKVVLAVFLAIPLYSFSFQDKTVDLNILLQEIRDSNYPKHNALYERMKPFRTDTLSINTLINTSKNQKFGLGEAFGENLLGIYFRDKSEYIKAIEHHKKSIVLAQKIGDIEMQISALNMLGVVYRRIDAVRSALDNHQAALELAENFKPKTTTTIKSIAISLNSIGNIYLLLRDYDLAEKYFNEAIKYELELNSDLGLAINYANLGISYEERGRFDEALLNYRKSLSYNQKIDSDLGIVICNNSIGQVYLKQGKPKEAFKLISPTIETADKIGDEFYMAFANINLGWALSEMGNFSAAERYLQRGVNLSKAKDMKQFLSDGYEHLSQLKEKEGQYEESLVFQRLSQEVQEKYLNEANHKYVSDLNMKYDTEKQKGTITILEKENEIMNIQLQQSRKNIWFITALFILAMIIIYILYRHYKLKNEKRVLKAEQKLMRSQMNPHFIFNSLLSIKIYMQNNNQKDAIEYLNQFAKLIRSILSSSLEKEITLREELDTMQLYVNIENIRFCNEISYNVKVDEDLDLNEIMIPSLILQPFVENALWHGLQPKEGQKTLSLEVHKKDRNFVEISITDNGIGRKRTMEIPSDKRNTQKKSIGINLTIQRLQNFSKNFAHMHSLNIIDLYDDRHNPKGTQVLLNLPVH